ncbi:MAG: ATP-binding protein [Bacteroidales bacterium]|nr:ATP-binding protein [Bacteroidales bacterium]
MGIKNKINQLLNSRSEDSGALLKEKALLESLIEMAPDAMVQTTTEGIIERINESFLKEFGFTREEVIGKNIDDLIVPPELRDQGIDYTKCTANNEIIRVDTYRTDKHGKKIYVNLVAQAVMKGEEITALNATYRNISNKKKDDDTKSVIYNISAATLTMSEFSDIFISIRNEIGKIWDTKNFYIVLYNKDTETLTLSFFQDVKDHFEEVPVKNTITGWLIKENRPVLLKEADMDELERKGEIALVGSPCKVWLGVPFSLENEISGAMVLQDYNDENTFTTEDLRLLSLIGNQIALAIQRKNMLNNLILERRKAEDAARLKQQFMSTMSHEIRTPLNEVIGINNLLLQGKPREDQMEYIKTLRFSANHLLSLVNDVLDYTKLESGNISLEKTTFDIIEFIDELKRSYSYRIKNKGLVFTVSIDKNIPPLITGDPVRLNQILSNLLSNAVKFTASGHIELSITEVSRTHNEIHLNFSVKDTGIGIPADKQDLIFESFKQASDDTTRKYGGTGLGLSISQKLVELQGGNLRVESKPGEGSRFFFSIKFPVAVTDERNIAENNEERWDECIGKEVLIAEDNKINYFVVEKFLKKWGINVSHAENGKIALDLIKEKKYDIILMDLHMPVVDGIEATEVIRNSDDPGIKNIPIIALTAAIMSDHEEKVKQLDFNDFILKPFKPRDLYVKILKHAR